MRPLLGAVLGPSHLRPEGSGLCLPPPQQYSGKRSSLPPHPPAECLLCTRRGRLPLGNCSSGRRHRLLCGPRRGVLDGGSRLGRPRLRDLVGVDVRRRAKQQSNIFNSKKKPKYKS